MRDRDPWRYFPELGFLFDLLTREGRREVAKALLVLDVFPLALIAVIYLVYGRGPQCVLNLKKRERGGEQGLLLRTPAQIDEEKPHCR